MINRKNRVSYPGPRFLSGNTWPQMPERTLNNELINRIRVYHNDNNVGQLSLFGVGLTDFRLHLSKCPCLRYITQGKR